VVLKGGAKRKKDEGRGGCHRGSFLKRTGRIREGEWGGGGGGGKRRRGGGGIRGGVRGFGGVYDWLGMENNRTQASAVPGNHGKK